MQTGRYYAAPAFLFVAEDMGHEDSQCQRKLLAHCRRKEFSEVECTTASYKPTHPRFRYNTLSRIKQHSWRASLLRWVHTCNVTAYRNAVTLQLTDTIRNYGLNFHPVPHGVTVSCERYTLGFPVCYGSPSDVFAASSGFIHLYALSYKEKEKRGAVVTCHVALPDLLRP
jgi:hypothetical protein